LPPQNGADRILVEPYLATDQPQPQAFAGELCDVGRLSVGWPLADLAAKLLAARLGICESACDTISNKVAFKCSERGHQRRDHFAVGRRKIELKAGDGKYRYVPGLRKAYELCASSCGIACVPAKSGDWAWRARRSRKIETGHGGRLGVAVGGRRHGRCYGAAALRSRRSRDRPTAARRTGLDRAGGRTEAPRRLLRLTMPRLHPRGRANNIPSSPNRR
jgi:hypothetical protein